MMVATSVSEITIVLFFIAVGGSLMGRHQGVHLVSWIPHAQCALVLLVKQLDRVTKEHASQVVCRQADFPTFLSLFQLVKTSRTQVSNVRQPLHIIV